MSRAQLVDVATSFARWRLLEVLEEAGAALSTSELRQQLEDDEPRRGCRCSCGNRHTRPRRSWVGRVGPLLEQLEEAGLVERSGGHGTSRVRYWRTARPRLQLVQGGGS